MSTILSSSPSSFSPDIAAWRESHATTTLSPPLQRRTKSQRKRHKEEKLNKPLPPTPPELDTSSTTFFSDITSESLPKSPVIVVPSDTSNERTPRPTLEHLPSDPETVPSLDVFFESPESTPPTSPEEEPTKQDSYSSQNIYSIRSSSSRNLNPSLTANSTSTGMLKPRSRV
ncbi:hypothetical protein C8J56DRAFT_369477 [Mycena floridula]|nr:hypothetical protein C8J56DRAFT_369477 [Mycena floridula]